ncbi:hypothetical protein [Achromobacter xylosoxidans]|uniref:Glycosyltransferase family 9 protein n=1 Tax=Alcaligenes xylosoxydans xylosoxydans TaxID=85698 RepID=A0A1R1JUG0_ALCXX|nr:hypothetical protein [Achromobacter xylosoxidans]OMG88000.1 hypothetical protein BIZ92_10410 [Achromobacter xylosoxidans]
MVYGAEAQQLFTGEKVAPHGGIAGVTRCLELRAELNSGAGAVALSAMRGAERVILLGYDAQLTGGHAHWHPDHGDGLGNAGSVAKWPAQFADLARRLSAVRVVNASRATALECFPRQDLSQALAEREVSKPPLLVNGMHGLGDNLHQRAVVRELLREWDVWLETPWPCLYHDLDGLKMVGKGSRLRTQAKNAQREASRYSVTPVPAGARSLEVRYPPDAVRKHGSVLAAMAAQCAVEPGDFRLPVKREWIERADALVRKWAPTRPILIVRPLVERKEWGGCRNRNPDATVYRELFEAIRDRFHVVSLADLEPGKEWLSGDALPADVSLHAGELDVEVMAGLFSLAAAVYTAPGFAVILAQAVGVPVVSVFGGYESSASFSAGAAFSPYLGLDPVRPCQCFSHVHNCDKRMDLAAAHVRMREFLDEHCKTSAVREDLAAAV